mgnify:CR=1 FL=1
MLIAFDTETSVATYKVGDGKKQRLSGCGAPRLVCVSIATADGDTLYDATEGAARILAHIRAGDTLVAHYAAFDFTVLCDYWAARGIDAWPEVFAAYREGRIWCTAVREKLLAIAFDWLDRDPRRNNRPFEASLAACAKVHLGLDVEGKSGADSWRLRYGELDGVPISEWPEAAREYATLDAAYCLGVAIAQGADAANACGQVVTNGIVTDQTPQACADFALYLAACWGPRTDPTAVDAFIEEHTAIMQDGERVARAAGFLRADGSKDMKALRALVTTAYQRKGAEWTVDDNTTTVTVRGPPETDGGQVSTSTETLEASGDPALIAYSESLESAKLITTYGPILRAGTVHPITSRPEVLVGTGRTAWSAPNLQNPPRKGAFRACFVPREGRVYCSVDYSQIELCAGAQTELWLFGRSKMADAINAGQDLHLAFAAFLERDTYEATRARYKAHESPTYGPQGNRQAAKVANFGFDGGMGAATFVQHAKQYGLELTEPRARELKEAWLNAWEKHEKFAYIGRMTQYGNATVKQFVSGRTRANCSYTQCANTLFQGLTADGAKAALVSVTEACFARGSVLFGVRPWVMLHDEIIAEGPEETAHLWAPEMARIMVARMQDYIPDVKVSAEPALMRRWYKAAETVYDAAGKLIPWEPK